MAKIGQRAFWVLFVVFQLLNRGAYAQCGYVANQPSGCINFFLDLTDTSSHRGLTGTSWTVTLPAGCSPSVLYSSGNQFSDPMPCAGTVNITMVDTINGVPCTKTGTATVYPKPTLHGSFSTTVTCTGACVFWRDSSTAGAGCSPFLENIIYWGDGTADSTPVSRAACKTYATNGTFSPAIFLENSCGCISDTTYTGAIQVQPAPTAAFTGSPLVACTTPLTSTMTATIPVGIPNVKYYWYVSSTGTFPPTPAQANGSNVFVHSYGTGTWSVKLVTIDTLSGCGDSTTQMNYVVVGTNAAACFTESDSSGCSGGYITFCPCVSGASTYNWSFPGPGTSPPNVLATSNVCQQIAYSQGGHFCAQLVVGYAGGCYDTLRKCNITLGAPVALNFTCPDSTTCLVPDSFQLTYTGTPCTNCVFSWNPPPNSTPTSHTGSTFYMNSYGTITPVLLVTDTPSGCTSTLIKTNYLSDQPLQACVNITYPNRNGCVLDTIDVNNCTSGGPFTSVAWNFPGGNLVMVNNNLASVYYTSNGCHNYSMIVQNAAGCVDTLRDSICVGATPTATVTVNPHDLCFEALCNQFSVVITPGDTPTMVTVWPEGVYNNPHPSFNMNAMDTFSNCYTYPDFGDFAYCFLVSSHLCRGDTICLTGSLDSVHIHPPSARLTPIIPCSNSTTLSFINRSADYDSTYWTFDGVTYPNPHSDTITFPFPTCGVAHSVSVTAINDTFGCQLTYVDSTISAPCYQASIRLAAHKGCYYAYDDTALIYFPNPMSIKPVDAQTAWSAQPIGSPMSFAPAYGDTLPTLALYLPGQYNVCARMVYSNGCVDTVCADTAVTISQPIAAFSVDDTAGCVPFCISTNNTSLDNSGVLTKYYWSFGDTLGRVDSVDMNPSHCYTTVGQFQLCLTVVDTNGCSNTHCLQVQANTIHANFTESDTITCTTSPSPLNPITYTNTSTGFVSTYQWVLPASLGPQPPTVGNVPSFSEQYNNQGRDSICLIAIDQFGVCRDTVCKPVIVANPIANYTLSNVADTYAICPPVAVQFIDSSQNNICSYEWFFNNGNAASIVQNPSQLYTLPGLYPATEIVTSCHGCTDTLTKYSIHINGPSVSLSASTQGGCPCLPVQYVIISYNADSIQFTTDGGTPPFVNLHVNRGTFSNPAHDTVNVLYCNVGTVRPYTFAFESSTNCWVRDDSLIIPIPIDTPNTSFSFHVAQCGADSACFTNTTTFNSIYSRDSINFWTFGDGTTDTAFSPCHVFPGPGLYTVTLLVLDQYLCGDSVSQFVYIPKKPKAAFTVNDSAGCIPFLTTFADSSQIDSSTTIVSGFWNIGNGTFYNTWADTSFNYTVGGNYTVTLQITDGLGCSDSVSHLITVASPPTDTISPMQTICLGDTTTLLGTGNANVLWQTDYNISDTLSRTPKVWPAVDTVYYLRVGNAPHCYVYDSVIINISHVTITQDTVSHLCVSQQASFGGAAQTVHATISSYNWSFGDGTFGTGNPVNHQYPTVGTYQDTLRVINSVGCRDSAFLSVTILDTPKAAMTIVPDTICLGGSITLTNTSTPGVSAALTTFSFQFNPASIPNGSTSPYTITPTVPGSYNVLLVQADASQCSGTAQATLEVHQLPYANFNMDTSCVNIAATFTSSSIPGDGPILTYQWYVNDTLQTQNSPSLTYTFGAAATDSIKLQVTDSYGCVGDTTLPVLIVNSPQFNVTPLDAIVCHGYSVPFKITGTRFSSVVWDPAAWVTQITPDSFVATPYQTIQYHVLGYYLQCTPAIDTVNIWVIDTVPVSAVADPNCIVLGLSSNITSTVKGTIDSITWSPDSTLSCHNCMNPIATPSQTTTYTATVWYSKDSVSCSNNTNVTVCVYTSCGGKLLYVPNTFSPNSDGVNDLFRIRGEGIAMVNYFRVYDRWGKLVYQALNANDADLAAWNGGYNNNLDKMEDSGVFVYEFEIQCITGQTISGKGNVTLLR